MPYLQMQDGTNIYYYDWGGSGPAVVLIHGWPLTSASWEAQARALAESGHRVIAYDRRGFGRSDWANWGYDYNTLSEDLATLIHKLDLHGATLVGFSMGGGEVARYLSRYGADRVSKAVLVSAVTPYLLKTENNPEGVDGKVFEEMIEGLQKDRPAFIRQFLPRFFGRTLVRHTVSEPMLDFHEAMAMTASPKATIDLVRAWSETDFRDDLTRIPVRTLVIHGTGDSTVPIEVSARRAVSFLPHGELIEYDGEPHGLNVTSADRLNADLLAFLTT